MPAPLPPYMQTKPTTFVVDSNGVLVDPFTIQAIVYDVSTPAKMASPLQVFPTPSGRADADSISTGYFSVAYVPDPGEARGRRIVRWFVVLEDGDDEITWTTPWEFIDGAIPATSPRYAMVSDLRDEGYTEAMLSTFRAQMVLTSASAMIEAITGRVFVPVPKVLSLDGCGATALLLNEPIITLDTLTIDDERHPDPEDVTDVVRVYNRHLRENLRSPDDRENPRVEYVGSIEGRTFVNEATSTGLRYLAHFPRGRQNVHVSGVFGFTEYDGTPMGKTPDLIRYVCLLLVRRMSSPTSDPYGGAAANAWRTIREKTRDQSVDFADPSGAGAKSGSALLGAFTGDPEIDTILAMFCRPPSLGAA